MRIDQETYLEHYGVKGMRWGVRKNRRASRAAAKDQARTKKYQDKYGLNQKEAQRRQRTAKTVNRKNARNLARGASILAGASFVALKVASAAGSAKRDRVLVNDFYNFLADQQAGGNNLFSLALKDL